MSVDVELRLITGSTATFTAWNGDAYSSDIYRSAVDTIARAAGKFKAAHYVKSLEDIRHEKQGRLNRLLQLEPNPYMNVYDFQYKITTHYFLYNNAFILIDRDEQGNILGFYPIDAVNVNFLNDEKTNEIYTAFRVRDGKEYCFNYRDIIHLKRHFNSDLFLGETNEPILNALKLAQVQNEGLINQIENSATIRGVLNFTGTVSVDRMKEMNRLFKESFLSMNNNGGVISTDNTMEFIPADLKPTNIDESQMKAVNAKIYSYLGVNENIVTGIYSENEWNAFYENVIEPYSKQLSLEYTRKVFTNRERIFGNEIVFNSDTLLFSNLNNKTTMVKVLSQAGVLTKNEMREVMGFPPLEGEEGNVVIQSLNNINADNADEYQMNKSNQ